MLQVKSPGEAPKVKGKREWQLFRPAPKEDVHPHCLPHRLGTTPNHFDRRVLKKVIHAENKHFEGIWGQGQGGSETPEEHDLKNHKQLLLPENMHAL